MAKAKTPRTNNASTAPVAPSSETNLTTMPEGKVATRPEVKTAPETKKHSAPIPINVEEEIRRRAYELSEQRGFTPGHENDDWFVAEREVLASYRPQQRA